MNTVLKLQNLLPTFVKRLRYDQKLAIAVFIILLGLRLMIINSPSPEVKVIDGETRVEGGLVFDEAHYIPAVRKLLQGESVNHEHPPLSKLLIAASMLVFGDNPLGWRLMPSLLSSAAVALIPLIAHRLTRSRFATFFTTFLIATDVMFFNIGTIAMLDGPAFFFLFLATYLFLQGRYTYAAMVFGLALLSKTSIVFNVAGLLLFSLLAAYSRHRKILDSIQNWSPVFEKTVLIGLAVFMAGLTVYDLGYGAYSSPFAHLDYMLNYHSQLKYNCAEFELPLRCTVHNQDGSTTVVDLPLSWITPISPFAAAPYMVVTVSAGERVWHPIAYYGIYSPYWWTTALVLIYSLYMVLKTRFEDSVQLFVFSWTAMSYLPYFIVAHLLQRWVYTFYFLPTLPAVALGLSVMLKDDKFSRYVLYGIAALQIIWFFIYFPVKSDTHIHILELLNLPR